MDKQWLVTYMDCSTWDRKCAWYDIKGEAMEFANERLEKQKAYSYTDGQVYVFPPNTSVKIEQPDLAYKLAKMMADCIDNDKQDITIDDFYDSVDVPMEDRTDFGTASLMDKANKYLDVWGY
jgi:hypothetical protein